MLKIVCFLYQDGKKEESPRYINFEAYKYRISCTHIMIIRQRSLKLVVTFLLSRALKPRIACFKQICSMTLESAFDLNHVSMLECSWILPVVVKIRTP